MTGLSTTVLAVLGALIAVALFMFRQSGKKAGAKQAKQESAEKVAEVKVEVINARAEEVHTMPAGPKYTAILQQYLRQRRAARLGKKN